jgi:acyl-CoA synthetase (AMP-forming)/AMP-acid ligase II
MQGYDGATDATNTALANGWLRTGDIGRLDPRLRLTVLGRADEVIISGGENIHPLEVEQALLDLEGIEAACVTAVTDEHWGEQVVAMLVGQPRPLAQLRIELEGRLARFKHPRQLLWSYSLPTTALGKPDRAAVRSAFTTARPSDLATR